MERTFVMVKPDGVQRNLVGEIISRFERKGIKLAGLKMMQITPELAAEHYKEHVEKPFFKSLSGFVTSSPVVAMVLEGPNVVSLVRNTMGALDPMQATPGSIRGDFTVSKAYNTVHGSDSPESAAREIGLFFRPEELHNYEKHVDRWIDEK